MRPIAPPIAKPPARAVERAFSFDVNKVCLPSVPMYSYHSKLGAAMQYLPCKLDLYATWVYHTDDTTYAEPHAVLYVAIDDTSEHEDEGDGFGYVVFDGRFPQLIHCHNMRGREGGPSWHITEGFPSKADLAKFKEWAQLRAEIHRKQALAKTTLAASDN